jgi:type I restriction-modification system DNA methylase subunit
MEYAELGYIDIEELKKYVELDFYFDPKPLSEIIGEDIDEEEDIEEELIPEITTDIESYKNPYEINKAIERLLEKKGDSDNYSNDELEFISYYSGYGGLEKFGEIGIERMKGLMYEFYTPDAVVKKMWALAYKYGYGTIADNSVFEPSVGIGAFLKYAPKDVKLVANEINEYSAKICEILYPNAKVELKYFEQNFLKGNMTIKSKTENLDKYSLVIGNPPYGKLDSKYAAMGEDSFTKAGNFTEYFITRGLDLLVQGGLLIYIVGAEQYSGGSLFLDSPLSKVKEMIFDKADLLDAYRLPINIFERTGVSSEIVVFKKR